MGSSSHVCCNITTDDRCGILKVSLSDKDSSTPGNTSMDVGISSASDTTSEIVCTYILEDVVDMFTEIIRTIMSNELENFVPPVPIDEQELLIKLLEELNYDELFEDDNDSNNLDGYSDIISLSSNSTFTINDVKENYEDILRNTAAVDNFLNSYI